MRGQARTPPFQLIKQLLDDLCSVLKLFLGRFAVNRVDKKSRHRAIKLKSI